jgi:phosphatidylserine decarboxylase
MFHKEGYKIIIIATLFVGVGFILIESFVEINWLNKLAAVILLLFYVIILQFFITVRSPILP